MTFYDGKIQTFQEGMDWISYDWDTNNTLRKVENAFIINKLYITKTEISYKTEIYELAEGLYEMVEDLYNLLERDRK